MASLRFTRPLDVKLADESAERARANHAQAIRELQAQAGTTLARGFVTGTTGALSRAAGVRSVSRSTTGTYVVTLETPIDPETREIHVQSWAGGGARPIDLDPALDTPRQFRVYTFAESAGAMALTDVTFSFVVRAL